MRYTAYIEYDPETQLYVATVPFIPGAHTQGATMEELRANLVDVIQLCLEEQPELAKERSDFVGLTMVEV